MYVNNPDYSKMDMKNMKQDNSVWNTLNLFNINKMRTEFPTNTFGDPWDILYVNILHARHAINTIQLC